MPIYESKCEVCANIEEQIQNFNIDVIDCPVCKNKAKRIVSLSRFHLKGGGLPKDEPDTEKPEKKSKPELKTDTEFVSVPFHGDWKSPSELRKASEKLLDGHVTNTKKKYGQNIRHDVFEN